MCSSVRYQLKRFLFGITLLMILMLANTQSLRADSLVSVAFPTVNTFGSGGPGPMSGAESAATSANPLFGAANVWNNLSLPFGVLTTNPGWTNLVDSTGASTGVGLSITGTVLPVNLYPYNPANYAGFPPLSSQFLAWNSHIVPGTNNGETSSISWMLTGLTPNATFDMCVYGSIADQSRSFNMTIEGTTLNIPTSAYGKSSSAGCSNFQNITSNALGEISGVGTGVGSGVGTANEANWSGFQIVQTPEPSSLLMVCFCLCGVVGLSLKKAAS